MQNVGLLTPQHNLLILLHLFSLIIPQPASSSKLNVKDGQDSLRYPPSCRIAIYSVCCSGFHIPAAFSPSGRGHFWWPTHMSPQKQFICHFFFFFPSASHISQNEQILDRNCTKDSNSASSKVGLVMGPTTLIIHSAFSTLSASQSSPICTHSPISFSSSQCTTRPRYTHQRWC